MVPARVDEGLRPGLAFMTFHFPDEADTNVLTINATDPKSGTAEFKATAVASSAKSAPDGWTISRILDCTSERRRTDAEREAVDRVSAPRCHSTHSSGRARGP